MVSLYRHMKFTIATMLCSLLLLGALSTTTRAQESPRPEPLHIKISPSQNNLSSKTINIISGATPAAAKPPIINKPDIKSGEAAPKQAKIIIPPRKPKHISTNNINEQEITYCDNEESKNAIDAALSGAPFTNADKDKKLANSLKLYMREKNLQPETIDAIYYASQETGVSFELMVIKAMLESDLGIHTASNNSSARGVFQYIDATWLALIKRHGERIGYKPYSDALVINPQKKIFEVKESSSFSANDILDLRHNPRIAALIKAYQIKDEETVLVSYKNGKDASITDHYIAHMLGLSLARTFYKLQQHESDIIPANLTNGIFKDAIESNRGLFYTNDGTVLNAAQIYTQFEIRANDRIKELRHIDDTYGNGNNVISPLCIPRTTEATLEIHTAKIHETVITNKTAETSYQATDDIEMPAVPPAPVISSVELLTQEPKPMKQ